MPLFKSKVRIFHKTTVPVLNKTTVSVLNKTTVPVLNKTAVPVLNKTTVPTLNQTAVPILNKITVPVLNKTNVRMFHKTTVPVLNKTKAHLFCKAYLKSWSNFCTINGLCLLLGYKSNATTKSKRKTKVHQILEQKRTILKTDLQPTCKIYLESWSKYFDDCTIDGLHLILGYNSNASIKSRMAILVYFLSTVGLMFAMCTSNVQQYLSYVPKTTTKYNFNTNLTFPTVSLMNQNRFPRSYIGGNEIFIGLLTYGTIISMNDMNSHYKYFMDKNMQTCASNSTWKLKINPLAFITSNNVFSTLEKFLANSSLNILRCWWQEKEIENGRSEFSVWNGDNRYGMSFNSETENSFRKKDFIPKATSTFGPRSGLRLLMNAKQDEYCGVDSMPFGAGFKMMLYNPFDRQPSTEMYPSVSFSPGYKYEISIQAVTYDLSQLEWRGYCQSHFDNPVDTGETVYYRVACFAICLRAKIYEKCKCLIYPKSNDAVDNLNVAFSETTSCLSQFFRNISKFNCMEEQLNHYFLNNPFSTCPECKTPCLETIYSYQISSTKLIPNRLLNLSQNWTDEDILKNIVDVNIYFGDLTDVTVIESLVFTSLDLFIYLANNAGLFIGISTLTLFEIIYQIIFAFHASIFRK